MLSVTVAASALAPSKAAAPRPLCGHQLSVRRRGGVGAVSSAPYDIEEPAAEPKDVRSIQAPCRSDISLRRRRMSEIEALLEELSPLADRGADAGSPEGATGGALGNAAARLRAPPTCRRWPRTRSPRWALPGRARAARVIDSFPRCVPGVQVAVADDSPIRENISHAGCWQISRRTPPETRDDDAAAGPDLRGRVGGGGGLSD